MRFVRPLLTAAAMVALGACMPRPAPPAPTAAPPAPPAPAPPPAPGPPPTGWEDAPLSPGDWSYRADSGGPLALFQSDRLSFSLRCRPDRVIVIGLAGAASPALVVRTSYGERRLPARADLAETVAELAASDPLFDQLAFSRGRFLVRAEGQAGLILPAWPEPARAIEDCRQ